MKTAFVIVRVSAQDQLKGYGPDVQWYDDVVPNAPLLGLEISEEYKRVIQEPATSWNRVLFEATVREAIELYKDGKVQAILFPRVERETRFVFGSFALLSEVIRTGLEVCFAREKLLLDPNDADSVERYFSKAAQAQAYVEVMKQNTARGKRRRLFDDKKLPSGRGVLYGYDYDDKTGQNVANNNLDTVRMMGMWLINERVALNEICRRLMKLGIVAPKGGAEWSRCVVGRILKNTAYAGKTYGNQTKTIIENGKKRRIRCPEAEWIEIPNAVDKEAFTWDEWLAINHQLKRNLELSTRNQKASYLLRGHINCKLCGRKYYGVPLHGRSYYRCNGRVRIYGDRCHSRSIKAQWVEELVWLKIKDFLRNPDIILDEYNKLPDSSELTAHITDKLDWIEQRLSQYNEAETRYLRLYGTGLYTYDKLDAEVKRIQHERDKLIKEKGETNKRLIDMRDKSAKLLNFKQVCQLVSQRLDGLTFDEQRLALEALNIKVWVGEDEILIEGTIPELQGVNIVEQQSRTPYCRHKPSDASLP